MPGHFPHAETGHPLVDANPTTHWPSGIEGSQVVNSAPKNASRWGVTALARENDRLKRELESQHDVVVHLKSKCEEYATQAEAKFRNDAAQIADLQHELQESRTEKEDLSQNLESCKDRIFSMLPVEGVADTQLQNQYIMLCNSIEYWLDNHFGDADGFIATLGQAGKTRARGNLITEYLDEAVIVFANKNPSVEIPIMQMLVFLHLYENLLGEDRIFPGLSHAEEECLGMVIEGLNDLNPAKDKDAILMWKLREKRLSEIGEYIMRCPQLLKGKGFHGCSGNPSLCHQIVQEVGDLANNIRQSMAEYEFVVVDPREIKGAEVKYFTVIDSRTGFALSSSAVPIAGPGGRVGSIWFQIYPAFVRKATESSKRIVLVKPTVVVKFDHPVPRGKKSKSSH
ncbi:hypothetical protein AYL99_04954 [Fonsecaea erecta]|uniref:Uncharacterized protein n=1 Tax=Fonsecaea erecta TaxID=1367422 RepID=A0A178ZJU9_9EURO|nr:hypothetical protein AYL99_04954 [Fonsecaea erecta]OAP59952.1 hypothetical protein AYL99_04954 [Fonsecaea erecta]